MATRSPIDLPLLGHARAVSGVAFHPNGHILASSSNDRTIVLWDVEHQRPLTTPYHDSTRLGRIAFTPDGGTLIAGGEGVVTFWQGDPEPEEWLARACRLAGRNFTRDEWRSFLGDAPYRVTCPQFAAAY